MGVSVPTYIQHENGGRGYPAKRADRYARFFRTTPEWLLYGRRENTNDIHLEHASLGPLLYVKGEVAAGVWLEAQELPEMDWRAYFGIADCPYPTNIRFGLRVKGDSMDLVYPHGTVLDCVRYFGDYEIKNGQRVIVQRYRTDGCIEATVKEYMRGENGEQWLVPRSSSPAFQSPIRCDQPEEGIERIEITAVVLSSIRPEPVL